MSPARVLYFASVSTVAAVIAGFMYFKMKDELGVVPIPFGPIAVIFGAIAIVSIAFGIVILGAVRGSGRRRTEDPPRSLADPRPRPSAGPVRDARDPDRRAAPDLGDLCRACGAEIDVGFDFCPRCGEKV